MSLQGYVVELGFFQGPLDLLLHLIKREAVDIYDIPIARITESFLEYVRALQTLDLEGIGEFLVMAATLMQIKSRMLLPSPPRDSGRGEDDDPRRELVQMLLEHQQYREAAQALLNLQAARQRVFTRLPQDGEGAPSPPLREVSLFDLLWALHRVWERRRGNGRLHFPKERITVAQQLLLLRQRLLRRSAPLRFEELFAKARSRLEVIVTFLALLELVRQGFVRVEQETLFGPIWIWATEALAA